MAITEIILKRRYRIGNILGRGSIGEVHLVTDINSKNEKKALKHYHIPVERGDNLEYIINHLFPDLLALYKCNHENIIKYYEHFIENGELYCVIEFCEGGNVQEYLDKNKSLPRNLIINWFAQMVSAVKYLHELNILHNDLKPLNMLIKNTKIKICDFGISKILESSNEEIMEENGTPFYMSAEKINGKCYGLKSDVWSLGVTFYEMVTNQQPFKIFEISETPTPELPEEFKVFNHLLSKMLEKDPEKRFDVNQVEEELKSLASVANKLDGGPIIVNMPLNNLLTCAEHDSVLFISYCRKDAEIVYEITNRLQKRCKIWLDVKQTQVGDRLYSVIEKGIRSSLVFVCFITKNYCESEACTDELAFAKKLNKTVLPIMLENEAINGVGLHIAQFSKFYAYKPPRTFNPWSDGLFYELLANILKVTSSKCSKCSQTLQEIDLKAKLYSLLE